MYRRVVSLLLLPFVLMSQSVTFGHCPGGGAAGHDPRPHIHLKSQPSGTKGGGRSEGCRCNHQHDEPAQDDGENPSTMPDPSPCQEGSYAVFFGSGDPVVVERAKAEVEDGNSVWCSAIETTALPCFTDLARPSSSHFSHAPPPAWPACPLYVRHLALLI